MDRASRRRHLEIGEQLHPVFTRALNQREHEAVRLHDAAPGHPQAAEHVRVQFGLQLQHAFPRAHFYAYHAVVHALHVQLLYGAHLVLMEGGHHDPAALEGKIQFLPEPVEHHGALNLQPGLEMLPAVVETAVNDA